MLRTKLTLLEDEAHRANALMKFLSKQAVRLKVGRHVYVVGGAVRDFVLKRPTKDIDVVIDSVALKGRNSEWFTQELAKVIPTQTRIKTNYYGVAILTVKGDWFLGDVNMRGEVIEVANAREESYGGRIGKGYKPSKITPADIKADIKRREFTFNTLLWRLSDLAKGPDKAEIIDMTGCGLDDLKKGVMRCVSSPDKTFSDDPTRMLRAIKFVVKYSRFKIPDSIVVSIRRNASKLRAVPPEAVATLLTQQILKPNKIDLAFRELDRLGLTEVIADIMTSNKSFRKALSNWAVDKGVAFALDLIKRGLPLDNPLYFLTSQQQRKFHRAASTMTNKAQTDFLVVLKEPKNAVKEKGFVMSIATGPIREFSPKFVAAARQVLLDNPKLASRPAEFRDVMRGMRL